MPLWRRPWWWRRRRAHPRGAGRPRLRVKLSPGNAHCCGRRLQLARQRVPHYLARAAGGDTRSRLWRPAAEGLAVAGEESGPGDQRCLAASPGVARPLLSPGLQEEWRARPGGRAPRGSSGVARECAHFGGETSPLATPPSSRSGPDRTGVGECLIFFFIPRLRNKAWSPELRFQPLEAVLRSSPAS